MPQRIILIPSRKFRDWLVSLPARALLIYIAAMISLVAITTAGLGYKYSRDLRNKVVAVCEDQRGPLRSYFSGQEMQTQNFDFSKLLPNTDPILINQLKVKQLTSLNRLVSTYDPNKCQDQY